MSVVVPVLFCLAPPLVALALLRGRARAIGWVTVLGMLVWLAGLGLVLQHAVGDERSFPTLGHLVWVAALPLIGAGIFSASGPHRLYVGPLMVFDVLLVATTWLMLIWRVCIWDPRLVDFSAVPWVVLGVMLSELMVFALVSQLTGNVPQVTMAMLAGGAALIVAADAVLLRSNRYGEDLSLVRLVLLLAGLVVCGLALGFMRVPENRPQEELRRIGRLRGVVTIALVALPLGLYILSMYGGPADAGSLVMSGLLLTAFTGREIHRTRQNRSLLAALADQARHDPLTGLPNRRTLEEELRYLGGPNTSVSVMTVDIDRFKEVNKELGHGAGDRVLCEVARVLTRGAERIGHRAAVCRLGGDEFALVSCLADADATALAERIRAEVEEAVAAIPLVAPLGITASVGLAAGRPDERAEEPFAVLTRSSQALRAAKEERNVVRFFSDEDARQVSERAQLERRLRAAVAAQEIRFVYEPIVELATGRVVGLETLARWNDGGVEVSPAQFIPLAEQIGLVHEISWQALWHSIQLRSQLRDAGIALSVSVNISPVQLRRPAFPPSLLELLATHDVPASDLTLEVTEGVFIDLDDPAVTALHRLYAEGVRIAIDDFGTGYSSLGYTTRLPAHVIKVDKALVGEVDVPQSRSIVQALLDVAQAHQVSVVMEGVETLPLCERLAAMGATYGQGWLFSTGQPAKDVPAMLARLGIGPAEPMTSATRPTAR